MPYKLFIISYILSSTFTFARDITGYVTDSSGQLLNQVLVEVCGERYATTNEDGFYSIEVKTANEIVFSYPGYVSQILQLSHKNRINITLSNRPSYVPEGFSSLNNKSSLWEKDIRNGSPLAKIADSVNGRLHLNHQFRYCTDRDYSNLRTFDTDLRENTEALIILNGSQITEEEFKNLSMFKITTQKIITGDLAVKAYGSKGKNGVLKMTSKVNIPLKNPYRVTENTDANLDRNINLKSIKNQYYSSSTHPISRVNLNVDDASYHNISRAIKNNEIIDPDDIDIEELINHFQENKPFVNNNDIAINTDTRVTKSPWNENILAEFKFTGKSLEPTDYAYNNVTFLIDVSGSMRYDNKLNLIKRSLKSFLSQYGLLKKSKFIIYSGKHAQEIDDLEKNIKMNTLKNMPLRSGMELAYKTSLRNYVKGGINKIILMSDGDILAGLPEVDSLKRLITSNKYIGIDVLGFGITESKENTLEAAIKKTGGLIHYIQNFMDAESALWCAYMDKSNVIAQNVKFQVAFHPLNVNSYRLIGYDTKNRYSGTESKDSQIENEILSGYINTVLYEIELNDKNIKSLPQNFPRENSTFNEPNTLKEELFTATLSYYDTYRNVLTKTIINQYNKLSQSKKGSFNAAVALFGMKIKDDQYQMDIAIDDVIEMAKENIGSDTDGRRERFIKLLQLYKNSYE